MLSGEYCVLRSRVSTRDGEGERERGRAIGGGDSNRYGPTYLHSCNLVILWRTDINLIAEDTTCIEA